MRGVMGAQSCADVLKTCVRRLECVIYGCGVVSEWGGIGGGVPPPPGGSYGAALRNLKFFLSSRLSFRRSGMVPNHPLSPYARLFAQRDVVDRARSRARHGSAISLTVT